MPCSARRPVVSTGNPRVTVAFPFSKVEIRDPPDAVRDLAAMVWRLAEQVAELAARRRLAGQRRRTAWPRRLADTRQPAQRDFPRPARIGQQQAIDVSACWRSPVPA